IMGDAILTTYRHDDGTYTTVSSNGLVTIPSNANSIRLGIQGGSDSGTEYIYLDNIVFEVGGIVPPVPNFRITNVQRQGGNIIIEWNSEAPPAQYQLEKSATLQTGSWQAVGAPITSSGAVTQTFTSTVGEGPQMFYRIRKL
ncbi:MAG: hypothetical protein ACR2OZ_11370, partial [Verrucomicrobiales bacterium]